MSDDQNVSKSVEAGQLSEEQEGAIKTARMKSGLETRAIYVKHLALEDYNLMKRAMAEKNITSIADFLRLAIRKLAGAL